MIGQRRFLTVKEVAERLEIDYRFALALVQDGQLDYKLRNPSAPNRKIYMVSAESVDKYERNHMVIAR